MVGWCFDPSGLLALDFQNPSVVGNGGNSENWQQKTKFPLAPLGVLAPGSAHARTSAQPPINTSRIFSAHKFGRGINKFEKNSDNYSRHFR